jgi:Putative auto-transporter adhesin, head GIN domain
MRNLVIFMALVGLFVIGSKSCVFQGSGCHFGPGIDGTGPIKTESRPDVRDFHAIDFSGSGDVQISQGDQFMVEVATHENLLPLLKTEVKNGTLSIYFDENIGSYDQLTIKITAPNIDDFDIAGSGNVVAMTPIRTDNMDISVAGSGDIHIDQLTTSNLDANVAGSGNVKLGGTATDADFDVAGSGQIDAANLVIKVCKTSVAGSGQVDCNVTEKLKASVAGSGDINYTGTATVEQDVTGSGSIERK